MKRLAFLVMFAALIVALTNRRVPLPASAEIMHTRGLAAPINSEWDALLHRLKQEDTRPMLGGMATLLLLQIHVDGSVPLWGLIVLVGSIIATAIGAVWQLSKDTALLRLQVDAHNVLDETRFDTMTEQIRASHQELRQDIRSFNASAR